MKFSRVLLVCMIFFACFATFRNYVSLQEEEAMRVDLVGKLYSERIINASNEIIQLLDVLEKIVLQYSGDIPPESHPRLSELVYTEDEISAISFVPKGIITYIYPAEPHKEMLGINIFKDESSKLAAIESYQNDVITFSGPYQIKNYEPALVVRNPVYFQKDERKIFWGFVSIAVKPIKAIVEKANLDMLTALGYEYKIQSDYRGESINLAISEDFDNNENAQISYFTVGETRWSISIYNPDQKFELYMQAMYIFAFYLMFISLICYGIANLEDRNVKIYKQSITDPLTLLNNRKGLEVYMKRHAQLECGLTVFYLDLDKFKPLNDIYGHDMGDQVLFAFSQRLLHNFPKNTFIARIGGDEFLLIVPESLPDTVCHEMKRRIIEIAERKFNISGIDLNISVSVGFARSPYDAKTFEGVISHADDEMRKYKELHHKGR